MAVSVGEQNSFVGDGGRLRPHADSEGRGGERDLWYDGGVNSTGAHGKEQGHFTTCANKDYIRLDYIINSVIVY